MRASEIKEPLTITLINGQEIQLAASKGSGIDAFKVAFFTASCDPPETNKRYASALKLDYPILSDPAKTTAKAYGVVHEGRPFPERWTFYIGPDGTILHIDKKVKAASHGADIVAQLEKLGAPKK